MHGLSCLACMSRKDPGATIVRGLVVSRRHFGAILLAGYADGVRDREDTASVVMIDFTFVPARVEIAAGQTVAWTNQDDVPHSVVHAGRPHLFKSGVLYRGERFSFRFQQAGQYAYSCGVYRHMQGVVVVT